jgi:general secretion pathway protein L
MDSLTGSCAGVKDSTIEYSMANALEQKLQQFQGRIQSGPLGKFFQWWFEELKQAMPASWQEKLQHALRRVTITIDGNSLKLGLDEGRRLTELDVLSLSQAASLQRQQINDLLEENELQESPRYLLLDIDSVLHKELTLPQAAEANLAQVLAFEMDRQTPFKAADVCYDWKVIDRGGPSGQIRLKLFVVPRAEVDKIIKVLESSGLTLMGVDVREADSTLGLNLLPPDRRVKTVNRKARLNYALAAAAVVLLALVMAQSLYLRAHQIAELEEAIAEVQGEARKVMNIKKQIDETSEAAGFLATRRAESPLAIELLADITRLLPDDTYLDRLVIGKTSVQLQGKSQNAQQLIELVNESELLNEAAFRGSTRLDARSGLEIFEVNAEVAQVEGG